MSEYLLPDGLVISSTSDLQGNILSYNSGFRDSSGYTDAELKGKPHSILRHSDMPKEAFSDMWQSLQAGSPWFGIVKNKRKNGDYYWVAANAAPIVESGRTVGYMSVRYPATRDQVNSATHLYAEVKAGRAKLTSTLGQTKDNNILLSATAFSASALSFGLLASGVFTSAMAIGSVTLMGVASLGYLLKQSLGQSQINYQLQRGVEDICNGYYRNPVNDHSRLGVLLNLIRSRVAEKAATEYDDVRSSNVMVKALDSASSNIMLVDTNFTIISVNKSLDSFFRAKESLIRQALPNFSANSVVGSNMDVFHKNPQHQRDMLSKLTTQSVDANLKISGMILRLTVIPIDMNGLRLGYVVEWIDRTIEATVIAELADVFANVKEGDFSHRIHAEATGIYQAIKQDVNSAMDTIQRALDAISLVVAAQAKGDLTQELPSGEFRGQLHDLKNAINYSTKRVKDSVVQAIQASSIVNDAAYQVSQGSSNLSGRVQEQAASLEQTSATMNEMASALQSNTTNAKRVADLAHQVQHQAGAGVEEMQKTIDAMQSIKESSNKIVDIVAIIDGIAFQTNLLALNAAVEAARAGEHGRGFAVVASEVRALAQKSADAAKDIKLLIGDSVSKIEAGTQLADKSGEMLSGITGSIEQVAQMIENISHVFHEQAQGIDQVNKAIADIDRVTQENAALVEETTAAAESLSGEAAQLQENMSFFRTGVSVNHAKKSMPSPQRTARLALSSDSRSQTNTSDEWSNF